MTGEASIPGNPRQARPTGRWCADGVGVRAGRGPRMTNEPNLPRLWAGNAVRLKKRSVCQGKLVRFSRFQSCPAKVSRPAGM